MKIVKDDTNFKKYLPAFATQEFLQSKSNEYGWFISEEAVLPFYIDRRGGFSKLVLTHETILLREGSNEIAFLNGVVDSAKSLKVDMIAQPLANAVFSSIPDNSKYIGWGSYVVDLSQSEDVLLKNMHAKHRNVIRKAIKDGINIQETEDVEAVFENLKQTMERQNRAFPSLNELKKLKNFSKFVIALKDGEIQGSAVLPYNRHGAFYLYGGSIAKPYTGSLNYMHYFAMLQFKREGVKLYDFMGARIDVAKGSKLEGIQRFKSRFGGDVKRGYLWKYPFSPMKISLMYGIQKIRFKLKGRDYLGDAIDQESRR